MVYTLYRWRNNGSIIPASYSALYLKFTYSPNNYCILYVKRYKFHVARFHNDLTVCEALILKFCLYYDALHWKDTSELEKWNRKSFPSCQLWNIRPLIITVLPKIFPSVATFPTVSLACSDNKSNFQKLDGSKWPCILETFMCYLLRCFSPKVCS